jgi:lambda family phage portal protein
MLKGIAVGFDVDYCTFASDLREVNYSSIRAGIQETREVWKVCQQFFIEHLHRDIYLSWLRAAMLTGALEGVLPRDVDRLIEPKFLPRGWGYVNPQQDAQADEMRVNNGFTTRTAVAADEGEDFEDILVTLSEEKKLADKYGISFVYAKGNIPSQPATDAANTDANAGN